MALVMPMPPFALSCTPEFVSFVVITLWPSLLMSPALVVRLTPPVLLMPETPLTVPTVKVSWLIKIKLPIL